MELTLFSSDSSGQYKKDIYNVIAAPNNTHYQFRYTTDYIDEKLILKLKDNMFKGSKALIVFRTNTDTSTKSPFLVPIRWATIEKTDLASKICIVDFVVNEYPVFNSDFAKAAISENTNIKYSTNFFNQIGRQDRYVLDYIVNMVSLEKAEESGQANAWLAIVDSLKNYSEFKDTFFFKTNFPDKDNTDNCLIFKEKEYKEVELWHYCANETPSKTLKVEIQCDPNYIHSVSGDEDAIECRYDKNSYGFQSLKANKKIKNQITYRIYQLDKKDNSIDYSSETKICIPVRFKNNFIKKFIQTLLSVVGSGSVLAFSTLISKDIIEFGSWQSLLLLGAGMILPAISLLISNKE